MGAKHEREARRRTHGLIAISQIKTHPPRCKPVNVWRLSCGIAVASQRGLQVIDQDEQNIRPLCPSEEHGAEGEDQEQSWHGKENAW
jgi:hypothetical protein